MTAQNGSSTRAKHSTGRTTKAEQKRLDAEKRRLQAVTVPGVFVVEGQMFTEQAEPGETDETETEDTAAEAGDTEVKAEETVPEQRESE